MSEKKKMNKSIPKEYSRLGSERGILNVRHELWKRRPSIIICRHNQCNCNGGHSGMTAQCHNGSHICTENLIPTRKSSCRQLHEAWMEGGGTPVLARRVLQYWLGSCPWGIPGQDLSTPVRYLGPETRVPTPWKGPRTRMGYPLPERTWDESLERDWEPDWCTLPPGGERTENITFLPHPLDGGGKNSIASVGRFPLLKLCLGLN